MSSRAHPSPPLQRHHRVVPAHGDADIEDNRARRQRQGALRQRKAAGGRSEAARIRWQPALTHRIRQQRGLQGSAGAQRVPGERF